MDREGSVGREDFFYVISDNYDEHAELAIPNYRHLHACINPIVGACWPADKSLRVLDLGVGTGKTSAVLLQAYENARVTGVDLFDEMLTRARSRLASFRDRVTLLQGDYTELELGVGWDLCVSALSIHHQCAEGKRRLFRRIAAALKKSGGMFLLIDWLKFADPVLQELALQQAASHVRAAVPSEGIAEEWIDHWRHKNVPDTAEQQIEWLLEAGFGSAACVSREFGLGLIAARICE